MGRAGIGDQRAPGAGAQGEQVADLLLGALEPGGLDVDRVHRRRDVEGDHQRRVSSARGADLALPGRSRQADRSENEHPDDQVPRPDFHKTPAVAGADLEVGQQVRRDHPAPLALRVGAAAEDEPAGAPRPAPAATSAAGGAVLRDRSAMAARSGMAGSASSEGLQRCPSGGDRPGPGSRRRRGASDTAAGSAERRSSRRRSASTRRSGGRCPRAARGRRRRTPGRRWPRRPPEEPRNPSRPHRSSTDRPPPRYGS